MDSSYRPTRLRAQLVIGLVGLHGVLTVVSLAGQAWIRHVIAVGDSLDGPVTHAIDQLQAFGEQASVVVEIGCAIAFLVWLYRAFANLPALGSTRERIAPGQRATPAGAVGVWFIPFANLVLPYRAVRHLFLESQPVPPPDEDAEVLSPRTPVVSLWWGLFLARNVSAQLFSLGVEKIETLDRWVELTQRMVIPNLLDVAASVLCIAVVRAIERRQVEQRRDQLLRVPVPVPTDQLR